MPTTLATRSRNESKLNGISRVGRRRAETLEHLPSVLWSAAIYRRFLDCHKAAINRRTPKAPLSALLSSVGKTFSRVTGSRNGVQHRIRQVVRPQAVGMDLEAEQRSIGRLAGAEAGLFAVTICRTVCSNNPVPSSRRSSGMCWPVRKQGHAVGGAVDGDGPVAVAEQSRRPDGAAAGRACRAGAARCRCRGCLLLPGGRFAGRRGTSGTGPARLVLAVPGSPAAVGKRRTERGHTTARPLPRDFRMRSPAPAKRGNRRRTRGGWTGLGGPWSPAGGVPDCPGEAPDSGPPPVPGSPVPVPGAPTGRPRFAPGRPPPTIHRPNRRSAPCPDCSGPSAGRACRSRSPGTTGDFPFRVCPPVRRRPGVPRFGAPPDGGPKPLPSAPGPGTNGPPGDAAGPKPGRVKPVPVPPPCGGIPISRNFGTRSEPGAGNPRILFRIPALGPHRGGIPEPGFTPPEKPGGPAGNSTVAARSVSAGPESHPHQTRRPGNRPCRRPEIQRGRIFPAVRPGVGHHPRLRLHVGEAFCSRAASRPRRTRIRNPASFPPATPTSCSRG